MLKLPLFVTLCGSLLFNYLHADAHSGGLGRLSGVGSGLGASSRAGMSGLAVYMLPSRSRPLRKFVDAYLKENNDELAEIRERSSHPFTIIDSVMDHYDLPEELRYLAVIESDLRPRAVSRVGATGPWQLMAGTARELGLKVGRRSDERTNYYKSTWAAALYLRDLHREFKDWLLVLAAYNAGPGPVYRAMKLAGSRNFWVLEKYLPGETRRHVRRFIATAYYFTISGPVVDPAGPVVDPARRMVDPAAPVVDPGGLAGDPSRLAGNSLGLAGDPSGSVGGASGLPGGAFCPAVGRSTLGLSGVPGLPGLMAAGLSDGVSEIGTAWRRNEAVM